MYNGDQQEFVDTLVKTASFTREHNFGGVQPNFDGEGAGASDSKAGDGADNIKELGEESDERSAQASNHLQALINALARDGTFDTAEAGVLLRLAVAQEPRLMAAYDVSSARSRCVCVRFWPKLAADLCCRSGVPGWH